MGVNFETQRQIPLAPFVKGGKASSCDRQVQILDEARTEVRHVRTDGRKREYNVEDGASAALADRGDGDRGDHELGGQRKAKQAVRDGHDGFRASADVAQDLGMVGV